MDLFENKKERRREEMNKRKKNPFYQSISSLLVGMEWMLKHLVFGYKIQLKKYAQNP